jgi:tetratricopeptide (TPR) repeat protein
VAQTFTDYRVLLALEPEGADETKLALVEFLHDRRFEYYVNDGRLGYALNVRGLLGRVRTPYYALLPHDDMWAPRYLELLIDRLDARPDAASAHGDMYFFNRFSGARMFPLADGPLFTRLMSFFLDGAEGMPWHGVGRSSALDREFPTNEFDGFAVECEWSLHLLLRGVGLHEPRAAYLKRHLPDTSDAVSVGWRIRFPEEQLRGALEHHRRSMLALLATADVPPSERRLLELAAEAAMLRRWSAFSSASRMGMGVLEEERAARILAELASDTSAPARAVLSQVHTSLGHYHLGRSRLEVGLQHLTQAAALAPENGDALLLLAHALMRIGRTSDALPVLRRAAELQPLGIWLANMQLNLARQVAQMGLPARSNAA